MTKLFEGLKKRSVHAGPSGAAAPGWLRASAARRRKMDFVGCLVLGRSLEGVWKVLEGQKFGFPNTLELLSSWTHRASSRPTVFQCTLSALVFRAHLTVWGFELMSHSYYVYAFFELFLRRKKNLFVFYVIETMKTS